MATKEVRFDLYCKNCVHYEKAESEDPCWDCLDSGWNEDSHRPVNYEEREGNENGKRTATVSGKE